MKMNLINLSDMTTSELLELREKVNNQLELRAIAENIEATKNVAQDLDEHFDRLENKTSGITSDDKETLEFAEENDLIKETPENVSDWEMMIVETEMGNHGAGTELIDIESLVGISGDLDYSQAIDIYELGGSTQPMIVQRYWKNNREYYRVMRGQDTLAAVRWLNEIDSYFEMIRCIVCTTEKQLSAACSQYDR